MSAYDHQVNVKSVRSECGTPGHSDAVITCSCGLIETRRHSKMHDPDVISVILYHRIAAIEQAIGMEFVTTFGEQKQ